MKWSESLKLYTSRHTFVCHGYSNRPVSSNTDSYIEACFRPPTSWRENTQMFFYLSCLFINLGRPSFLSITNHVLSIILHRRRKVLNIGGGRGHGSEYWGGGGGGGGKGGQTFRWL